MLILESPADGVRRLSPGGPYVIGRDAASALRLDDPTVSKVHAAVSHDGRAWLLEDRGSFNGTLVNDVSLTGSRRLRDGDAIRIGETRITVRLAAAADITHHDPDPSPRPGVGAPVPLPSPGADGQITIGRAPGNRIVLHDPMVSSHHARVVTGPAGPVIEDLGSYNGTFVDDRRVRSAPLAPGARIRLGNTRLELDAEVRTVVPARARPALRADAVMLLADDGSQRLAPATVEVESGELVAILGPAGAGKSTLMNVLAGLVRPTAGHVTVGGQDLAAASSELAYVPQDDIVHRDLTPREALTFAAGLRLPPDHGRAEIRSVVDRLLTRLDLDDCADRVIHNVSGGQRKRASAAMELVGDPRLLFMDEPAAGLDAAHDRDLMALLRQLADDGRAVVLTTHNTWHLSMCDRLLIVGRGGVLRYDGRPDGVEAHFGVGTFTDVYDALDVAPAEPVAALLAAPRATEDAGRQRPRVVGRHVRTLTHRNLRILTRDGRGLVTALLAAPAMAALAVALFGGEALRRGAGSPFDDVNLLLALALVATWLGAFAGLRAIVTESLAWRRESSIGVAPLSYLIGKWLVHGALVIVQAALIAVAAFGAAGTDLSRHTLVLLAATIAATALAGLSGGLAVSAASRTEARAITLVLPYVVLQFFFAGVVVPVGDMGVLRWLSEITSARWGVAGLGSATHLGRPPTPAFSDKYGDGFFAASPATYLGAIAAIAVATALLTLLYVRRAGASRA